ncbi:gustatory receptor for sugar taste 64a-like [Penaeus vannamei]|uniref:gustatory receptor for sugar taste 64a-like n=1 Tax=Penaeus vannamei TaxID=6689 RepID=UPI00387F4FDB
MRAPRRFRSTKHGFRRVLQRLLSAALAGVEGSPRPPSSAAPAAHEAKGVDGRMRKGAWYGVEEPVKCQRPECLRCLVPVTRLFSLFGLLPMRVVDGQFRFVLCHFLTLYACVVAAALTWFSLTRVVALFAATGPQDWVQLLTGTTFYLLGATGALLLLQLARKLPAVLERWADVERQVGVRDSCKWKVLVCMGVVTLSAAGETTASMFHNVPENTTGNFWLYLETYVRTGHKYEVDLLGYSRALGLAILTINKYATFLWNFVDVLVFSVAIVLLHLVRAFNAKLQNGCATFDPIGWRDIRRDHLALLTLVQSLNASLGPLVLQSYLTNIFFTLVQLYFGLSHEHELSFFSKLYLTWSFLHLLGRLAIVSFSCALIHEESYKGISCVLEIPENRYSLEVWRLEHQIRHEVIGLSGCGFFLVNKSFILATTGALVTYEVILLQVSGGTATNT